jgi:hypothetical protein
VPVVREVEVPANPEVDPSDAVETPGAPRWLDRDDISEDERRLFCEKLVSIPWLPAKLRSALWKETIAFRRKVAQRETYWLWCEVNQCKRDLRFMRDQARRQKKYPNPTSKKSLHDQAIEKVAVRRGMTFAALKKRIERHRPSQLDL